MVKSTEKNLLPSRAELKAIYDHAPVMMCVVDEERRVLSANPAFTAFTGVSEEELKGGRACGIFGCINAQDDPRGCGFGTKCDFCGIRLAMEDSLATGAAHQNVEYKTALINGTLRQEVFLLGSTSVINDAAGKRLLLCLHDVSACKELEEAFRKSESRLNLALKVAKMGYWLWDVSTNTVQWFAGHEKLFGIPRESFGGTIEDVQQYVHPDDRAQGIHNFQKTLNEQLPFDNSYRVIHPDGTVHWLHSYGNLHCDEKGEPVHIFGVTQDITDRKRLEHVLLEASERERQRLGQELHDNLCQDLKGLEFEAALVENALRARTAPEADRAGKLGAGINQALKRAYALARGMLSIGIDEKGLGAAITELVRQLETDVPMRLKAEVNPECRPPSQLCVHHLFRIAQEALANAVRHSGATEISLYWGPGPEGPRHLELTVRDNGRGLPPDRTSSGGMGLAVMRTRAEAVGASLYVRENPGGGTMISCVVMAGSIPGVNQ